MRSVLAVPKFALPSPSTPLADGLNGEVDWERGLLVAAKIVHHARQVIFQMAGVAVSKELFEQILERIWALAPGAG